MLRIILSLAVSYLIGSIPFAYFLGKVFKKIDIREHGSGNIGATNAFRVLGPFFGIFALLFDAAKGLVCPTLIADYLAQADSISWNLTLRVILGVAAVSGHNWTIFLRFKGGKGVATSLGVMLGLAIISASLRAVLGITILAWLIIFLSSGFVSLSSVISALLFPVFILIFKVPFEFFVLGTILSVFIIFRHKSNIHRLLRKEEHRFDVLRPIKTFLSSK